MADLAAWEEAGRRAAAEARRNPVGPSSATNPLPLPIQIDQVGVANERLIAMLTDDPRLRRDPGVKRIVAELRRAQRGLQAASKATIGFHVAQGKAVRRFLTALQRREQRLKSGKTRGERPLPRDKAQALVHAVENDEVPASTLRDFLRTGRSVVS